MTHSEERIEQTVNEERLLSDQNKTPSVFAKPNDANLAANSGYYQQADNQHGGNGYDHADNQYGRYGYDHQVVNRYDGNGYDHAYSQYVRYGYDHHADNQYGNGFDFADY